MGLTRWVLRSPKTAITVLAPPKVSAKDKPSQILIYPGDASELAPESILDTPIFNRMVEIQDDKIAQRLQHGLERLWYSELRNRQLNPAHEKTCLGPIAASIDLVHRVTARGRVVCCGARMAYPEGMEDTCKNQAGLVQEPTSFEEFEIQCCCLAALQCTSETKSNGTMEAVW